MADKTGSRASATRPITAWDAASAFSCGEPALDDFFARHALGNHERGIGTTFVLRGTADDEPPVLGFYTLSMADVDAKRLSKAVRGQLPRYPLPVALIGRLAVHDAAQGKRVGQRLLVDALRRAHSASEQVGCIGVIVDAKSERAEGFYLKYGFTLIDGSAWPHRLFLPMATIRAGRGL